MIDKHLSVIVESQSAIKTSAILNLFIKFKETKEKKDVSIEVYDIEGNSILVIITPIAKQWQICDNVISKPWPCFSRAPRVLVQLKNGV